MKDRLIGITTHESKSCVITVSNYRNKELNLEALPRQWLKCSGLTYKTQEKGDRQLTTLCTIMTADHMKSCRIVFGWSIWQYNNKCRHYCGKNCDVSITCREGNRRMSVTQMIWPHTSCTVGGPVLRLSSWIKTRTPPSLRIASTNLCVRIGLNEAIK